MATIPSLISELKKCANARDLKRGKELHAKARQLQLQTNVLLTNTLIAMYSKCCCLKEAKKLFDQNPQHSVVSWNILISGYADNGEEFQALDLFSQMISDGNVCSPDALTFVAAVKACTNLITKEKSNQQNFESCLIIHTLVVHKGANMDNLVANTLINMYAKCSWMKDAQAVFDRMQYHDVVSWNTLLFGYVKNEENLIVLELFSRMNCKPDALTFIAALKACSSDIAQFVQMHWHAVNCNFNLDFRIANTLIDLYSKLGSLIDAQNVFQRMSHRTVVSWNVLISGYAENGDYETALDLFSQTCLENVNALTFVAALKAGNIMASKEEGKYIDRKLVKLKSKAKATSLWNSAVKRGCASDIRVANGFIKMFGTSGYMNEAQRIFSAMRKHDVVSWTVLTMGYAENGMGHIALQTFLRMRREGLAPDSGAYVAGLKACGTVNALHTGREMHADILACGLGNDPLLLTCLLDFYAKCGSMDEAQKLFDTNDIKRDLIAWNALLSGYSRNGNTSRVFDLFNRMKNQRLQPNGATFICVLAACSHSGFVDKGKQYFEEMSSKHNITPDINHYHCMIDMLGRANQLKAALAMVECMPFVPTAVTWITLLAACKKWANVEIGTIAYNALDDGDPAANLLMANVYTDAYNINAEQYP